MHTETHLIVGPGALGRLVALHLAEPVSVVLAGRRPLPARQTLTTPEGERRTHRLDMADVRALPAMAPSFIHLTTKAYASEAAYASLFEQLPATTPLVLWQNGYQVQPELSRRHPGPVLCASTTEGAWVANDGAVVHAGRGMTYIGDLAHRHAELSQRLAGILDRAGLAARAVDDIATRLWHKLVINAVINPLTARFRIRNGQLRDPPFRSMVERLVNEIAPILSAEDIEPPDAGWHALVWRVVEGTAHNRASMLQDVLTGRPLEREAILQPLMVAAVRHGLATPFLAELDRDLARLSPS
ncbi:2-dehydropantoate 2-reductase [Billgrantia pellis]|uniref:2-dehydropantoate 2-reductase n=1 Tax=Billgrantia pellis TaxID=2606936 RepID=A0A7V7FYM6_9GAMM|nr:2-dehydropantoate 2-reductase [Halomonas pellis]KAA0011474.1 2-dehydropantoate 2-reductase [Halomonas pellis]